MEYLPQDFLSRPDDDVILDQLSAERTLSGIFA